MGTAMKIFAALAVVAMAALAVRQFRLLKSYCYNLVGWKIKNISVKQVNMNVMLSVKNPSDIPIMIQGYSLDLLVNGKDIGDIKSTAKVQIKPKSYTKLEIPISFDTTAILKDAINIDLAKGVLLKPEKVKIGFKGIVSLAGVKDIPINIERTLKQISEEKETEPC